MQYHVYDIVDPALVFSQRLEMLRSLTESSTAFIHVVATTKCDSQKNADEAYGAFLAANYEGGIYRLDKLYETGKRSSSLLKRKDFMDGEFSVVSISEGSGNWAGSAKHMTLRKPDGVTFGAGIRGSYKQNVKLLKTAINEKTTATVRYFQLTADGIPRFGVVTDFHVSGRQD
jgi:ATP-dependent DNA ligase